MRLLRPPLRFWTLTTLAALIVAFVVGMLAYHYAQDGTPKQELIKIYVQAMFAALFGGVLMTFLNVRRDEDQREMAREAAVREIVEEMHAVHRKLKMVKRRLRSQMAPPPDKLGGTRTLPFTVPVEAFEKAMDELLAAQIEAEQIRDSVRARDDLISAKRIERVYTALDYAARYAHDVYQTFEDCTIRQSEKRYEIDEGCGGLVDFLGRLAWDKEGASSYSSEMTRLYRMLKDENATIDARYVALEQILDLRRISEGKPRYRIVATECIALAAADLQRAVRRERWRTTARTVLLPRQPAPAQAGGVV
jgi:hypothetical protein